MKRNNCNQILHRSLESRSEKEFLADTLGFFLEILWYYLHRQYSTNLDSYVETLSSEPVELKRVVSVLNDGKFPYNHVLAHTVLCIGTEVAPFPLSCPVQMKYIF